MLVKSANAPENKAVSPARAVVLLVPNANASVIPYPAIVVGLPVKLANVCAGTLVNASVIPYPATVVGLLVIFENANELTVIPVNAEPSIAGKLPDNTELGIKLLTPSTSRVLSSPNTEPFISLIVFVVLSSAKFSLILSNAVLNGSPSPLFALEPILITCIAIKLSLSLLL